MSLIFTDGFDVYGEAQTTNQTGPVQHWGSGSLTSDATLLIKEGRYSGSKSLVVSSDDGYEARIQTELPTVVTSGLFIMGFNFKRNHTNGRDFTVYLSDGITFSNSNPLLYFSGSSMSIRSLNSSTGSSVTAEQWHHVEIVYDTTADTLNLYLDDALIYTKSFSMDPRYIRIRHSISSSSSSLTLNYIDDFYVLDDTGDSANGRLGDTARIDTIFPSGETSVADWTTLDTNTWGAISGIPSDDTTSIYAVSSGDKIVFNWTDIQSSGIVDVNAISIRGRSEDVDLTDATFQPVMSGTALVDIGDLVDPPVLTDNFYMSIDVNPETGSQWTESEINSLKLGFRSH